jgi:Zn finger protein HypA/HybF involved in hydrogenase expression
MMTSEYVEVKCGGCGTAWEHERAELKNADCPFCHASGPIKLAYEGQRFVMMNPKEEWRRQYRAYG